jgi:hypothetical protein
MNKFKVGDTVRRMVSGHPVDKGDIAVVLRLVETGWINLEGQGHTSFHSQYFSLVDSIYPNQVHPHREVILEWVKGAVIEYRYDDTFNWSLATSPNWQASTLYRVKPQADNSKELLELKKELKAISARIKQLSY